MDFHDTLHRYSRLPEDLVILWLLLRLTCVVVGVSIYLRAPLAVQPQRATRMAVGSCYFLRHFYIYWLVDSRKYGDSMM